MSSRSNQPPVRQEQKQHIRTLRIAPFSLRPLRAVCKGSAGFAAARHWELRTSTGPGRAVGWPASSDLSTSRSVWMSTIIRNRRFLNLCRDAAFKLRTPQDEGLASSLAARNGAEVVRGLGDNTPRLRRQRRQTRPDIGRVDP